MIQTTEGYLAEVHDMLNRMVELSEKSANGTYETVEGGANAGKIGAAGTDRNALQSEMDQLCAEIDRIAATANFNNVKLFNGDLATKESAKITSLSGTTAQATQTNTETAQFTANSLTVDGEFSLSGTLKATGDGTDLTVSLVDDDGAILASQTLKGAAATTTGAGAYNLTGDLEGISFTRGEDAITGEVEIGTISQEQNTVGLDFANTFDSATVTALNDFGITGLSGISASDADKAIEITATAANTNGAGAAGSISVKIGETTYTGAVPHDSASTEITLTDGINTITATIDAAKFIDNFGATAPTINSAGVTALNADETAGTANTKNISKGDGLTLQIGETSNAADKLTVGVDRLHTDTLFSEITDYANSDGSKDVRLAVNESNTVKGTTGYTIDISGQQRASAAAEAIRGVINKVSTQRASLGAMQNRLDYTVNNLNTASENVTAANSRIRDTDMAKEMTKYTQMNVLSQAAQAMLAQANSQPQSVLQLLG
jgi:flagellin